MNIEEIHSFLTDNIISERSSFLLMQLQNNSNHNRIYSEDEKDREEGYILTYFNKPLYYAKQPYFCPNGWRRYSLDLGLNKQEFQKKYQDWPVAYHGTSSKATFSIWTNGFRANKGCWIGQNEKAVYLTPSIVYASHPRYAKIQQWNNMYIQVVLQVRVKKNLFVKKAGTLKNAFQYCPVSVDKNYNNNQLQWVCKWNKDSLIKESDGILVYGIMIKITASDPTKIEENDWYALQRND